MTDTDYINGVVWCREFFPSSLIPSAGDCGTLLCTGRGTGSA